MAMEFLVTVTNENVEFTNKELKSATTKIFKLGDAIKKNWFEIAHIVADVESKKAYEDDGFSTVHEWTEKTFGIKKSASYNLLTIGKEYTRTLTNAAGKVTGYATNLTTDPENDFSKSQVEYMLPLGHEKATELVNDGTLSPAMSARDIKKVVKELTTEPEEIDSESTSEEVEPETTEKEIVLIEVRDTYGNAYDVPEEILMKYIRK